MVVFHSMVLNAPVASQEISPPQEHQPLVDPFPSSPIVSSSLSSSSPGEILDASNQEAKKKKKRKNKKKKNKQGGNQPTTVVSVDNVENPTNIGRKPKFPCRICKGDHLLNHFPGIPKVLEVWSMGSQQPMSPATASHAGDNPSTNDHKVGGKKGKVRIPCRLCGEMHLTYLFPHMDEASQLLEDIVVSQKQPPVASHESSPNQPLVDEVVGLIQSSVDPTLPLESEVDTTQVFLVTSYSSGQGGISPISMEPPPSTEVISFDWNRLVEPHLPSCMPFQITVQVCDKIIHHTIVDEGAYVSILSSTTWKAMVSPQLVSVTHHLLDFNRISSEPLGILPQLPITLGGKNCLYRCYGSPRSLGL
jgi:hypothetical protein